MTDHTPFEDAGTVPFAGFWRRVAAFLVDGLVLGLIGHGLGLALFDAFVAMGPWGRVVGFGMAMAYFVAQESGRGGGQSLGKRLLRIRVVDVQGRVLSPARSVARFTVFGVPYFLNGAALPMGVMMFAGGVPAAAAVLGGVLALAYLLVFNRRTRQSLHDLAVGAFVVRVRADARGERDVPGPVRVWPGHRVIAGALIVLAGAAPAFYPLAGRLPPLAGLMVLEQRLQAQPELKTVGVHASVSKFYGATETVRRTLLIEATVPRLPADNVPMSTRLAGIALASYPGAALQDLIEVRLSHGYDIGIASSWTTQDMALQPAQWADRVAAGVAI